MPKNLTQQDSPTHIDEEPTIFCHWKMMSAYSSTVYDICYYDNIIRGPDLVRRRLNKSNNMTARMPSSNAYTLSLMPIYISTQAMNIYCNTIQYIWQEWSWIVNVHKNLAKLFLIMILGYHVMVGCIRTETQDHFWFLALVLQIIVHDMF